MIPVLQSALSLKNQSVVFAAASKLITGLMDNVKNVFPTKLLITSKEYVNQNADQTSTMIQSMMFAGQAVKKTNN